MANESDLVGNEIKLLISTPNNLFKIEEPIDLSLVIKNNSKQAVLLVERAAEVDFNLTIIDENGTKVSFSDYGLKREKAKKERESFHRFILTLLSGASVSYQMNLIDLFNMKLVGKYIVKASRTIIQPDQSLLELKSNEIIIILTR